MDKPFKDLTSKQIIEKMNETGLDLIDPMYQEMKQFITMILNSDYFNSKKTIENQNNLYEKHIELLNKNTKDNNYNNAYHRAVQIKELLNVWLIEWTNGTWCYSSEETDLSKQTISDTPAEATKKLVEWFGEM